MPQTNKVNVRGYSFYYSWEDNIPSAVRIGPWKMYTRISSQTGNNFGFKASRNILLLVQVEQHLGERIDWTGGKTNQVEQMMEKLTDFDSQVQEEGSLRDAQWLTRTIIEQSVAQRRGKRSRKEQVMKEKIEPNCRK